MGINTNVVVISLSPLGSHPVVDPLAERDLCEVAEEDEVAQDDLGAPLGLLLPLLQFELPVIIQVTAQGKESQVKAKFFYDKETVLTFTLVNEEL